MANPSTISNFLTALNKSGLRSNLFEVTITKTGYFEVDDTSNNFRFLCRASSFPGLNITEIPLPYFGRQLYFPGTIQFGTWSTTIINDEGFQIRNEIEKWMDAINSHVGNVREVDNLAPESLYGSATVKLYTVAPSASSDGFTPERTIQLVDCWPSALGDITLSYSADEIESFDVQWQFNYFTE